MHERGFELGVTSGRRAVRSSGRALRGVGRVNTSGMESSVRFGEVLISWGKLTERQLLEALGRQRQLKGQGDEQQFIGDMLVSLGFVSQRDVARALARYLGLGCVDLGEVDIDPSAVELLGEDLMRRYAVMPLRVEYGRLKIAMSDPSSTSARADLGLETGFPLDVDVASAEDIRQVQERLFTSHAGTPGPTEHSTAGETPEAVAPDMGVVEAEGPTLILRQGMRTLEMKVDPGVAGLVGRGVAARAHDYTGEAGGGHSTGRVE